MKEKILLYLRNENIKNPVIDNTLKVFESFHKNVKDKFDSEDSIYVSNYKTVIIEYKDMNNIFTLEIGEKSFGYFSEINSKLEHYCEEEFINNESISQLNNALIDYFNKI